MLCGTTNPLTKGQCIQLNNATTWEGTAGIWTQDLLFTRQALWPTKPQRHEWQWPHFTFHLRQYFDLELSCGKTRNSEARGSKHAILYQRQWKLFLSFGRTQQIRWHCRNTKPELNVNKSCLSPIHQQGLTPQPSLGGLEPPTSRLTAERAGLLRHRDSGSCRRMHLLSELASVKLLSR